MEQRLGDAVHGQFDLGRDVAVVLGPEPDHLLLHRERDMLAQGDNRRVEGADGLVVLELGDRGDHHVLGLGNGLPVLGSSSLGHTVQVDDLNAGERPHTFGDIRTEREIDHGKRGLTQGERGRDGVDVEHVARGATAGDDQVGLANGIRELLGRHHLGVVGGGKGLGPAAGREHLQPGTSAGPQSGRHDPGVGAGTDDQTGGRGQRRRLVRAGFDEPSGRDVDRDRSN